MVTNFILTFAYDPMGQRISKTKQVNTTVTKSYYFRDAQGQILQVMNSTVEADGTPQYSFEYPVYGSSRLGTKYPSISTTDFQYGSSPLVSYSNQVPLAPAINRRVINIKASVLVPIFTMVNHGTNMTQYELTNHLGNVMTTIKDEKEFYTVSMGSGITYTRSRPIVLTATDYYPFGMPMPNRTYSLSSKGYRFGFNTQEKDDEVYGEGNLNTAQFWEYDTRLGRRWNVDPIDFPDVSPFATFDNNPILFSDIDGLTPGKEDNNNTIRVGGSSSKNKIKVNTSSFPRFKVNIPKFYFTTAPPDNNWKKLSKTPIISNLIYVPANSLRNELQQYFRIFTGQEMIYNLDGSWHAATGSFDADQRIENLGNAASVPLFLVESELIFAKMPFSRSSLYKLFRSKSATKGVGSFFQGGRIAKASELVGYAEQQGWKAMQSAGGPLKYVDKNGVIRMTIKQGSQRAAGSGFPHVELRNALGKRIDAFGNEVTRKGLDNHTEIIYDLKW